MSDRIISPNWQQILDRIDAHGASQKPDVPPPPAPIVVTFWLTIGAWAGVLYALGVVLGMVG